MFPKGLPENHACQRSRAGEWWDHIPKQ